MTDVLIKTPHAQGIAGVSVLAYVKTGYYLLINNNRYPLSSWVVKKRAYQIITGVGRKGNKGNMNDRQPTKIMVSIINTDFLDSQAFEKIDKERFPRATHCRAGFSPHGFVETPKGIYALCSEGVGDSKPISQTNKYEVDYYAEYEHGGYMMPAATIHLTDIDLKMLSTGEKVNLAEFIRTFGARLESNYHQWRTILEKEMKG